MKKIIWWIVGGVFLTAIAFFIPEQSGSMWPSMISSSIVILLYLIVFLIVWLPKIESRTKRRAVTITFAVIIIGSAVSATLSYKSSANQLKVMPEIRTTIDAALAETFIKKPLLETLRMYHSSENTNRNIGEIFTTRYDSLITRDSLFTYGSRSEDQTIYMYVDESSSEHVVLIGESSYIDGNDADFDNFSGAEGRYQVRGILTLKGIDYERQN